MRKTGLGGTGGENPRTRARDAGERARCARGNDHENRPDQEGCDRGQGSFWPTTARPASRTERHLAAAEARRIDPVLRRVSVAHVAALAREWHLAGWTIADIRYALDHHPDGTPWPHNLITADIRHVPGWVRHRLTAWRTDPANPASPPRLSRSQRAELAHAAEQDAHAQLAAAAAATEAAKVPAAEWSGDWTTRRADLAARTAAAATARRQQAATRTQQPDQTAEPVDTIRPAPMPARTPRTTQPPAPTGARAGAPGSLRPANQTTDPHISALRAANRTRLRPRR